MDRVLIIGASGLVGGYLNLHIPMNCKAIGTYYRQNQESLIYLDITDLKAIRKIIKIVEPDVVFLAGAITNVDECDTSRKRCLDVNVKGVEKVVRSVGDSKLVFFSTDFIFDGTDGPYGEDAYPNPVNLYGQSKLEAEEIVKTLENHLIIRTTCVYGWEREAQNFAMRLIRNCRGGVYTNVFTDYITTPTYAGMLARVTWELVDGCKRGVYNVCGSSRLSRYEFAEKVVKVFNLDHSLLVRSDTNTYPPLVQRPVSGGLVIDKVQRELNHKLPSVDESLTEMLNEDQR